MIINRGDKGGSSRAAVKVEYLLHGGRMSRHSFHKAITTATEEQEDLTDFLGYGLFDWVNVGVLGYDESLETFFFNIEGNWIFGTEPREIPSIHIFQAIFSAIFQGA